MLMSRVFAMREGVEILQSRGLLSSAGLGLAGNSAGFSRMNSAGTTSGAAAHKALKHAQAAEALRAQGPATLRTVIKVLAIATVLWGISALAVFPGKLATGLMLGVLLVATLAAGWMLGRSRARAATALLLTAWSAVSGTVVLLTGGLHSPCLYMPLIPTIIASLTMGRRAHLVSVGVLAAFCTLLLAMDLASIAIRYPIDGPPWALWLTHSVTLGVVCVIVGEAVVGLGHSLASQKLEIEARRQAERSLRESELRLSAVVSNCPAVAVQWFDASGKVIFWNSASTGLYGYSAQAAMGRSRGELILVANGADRFRRVLEEIGRSGLAKGPEEYEFRRQDGSTGTCLSTAFAIPGEGSSPWFVCMDIDVTELKGAEERLRQSQKLRAIGQLAGGVAHDFNNLLTVIKGYGSQVLEHTTRGRVPGLPAVEAILDASERAQLLTRQLLTFARQQIIEPKVIDLNAELGQMHMLLRKLCGPSITLDVVPRAEGAWIRIDPSQLQQVVMNLALNARDAMPSGGLLRIETLSISVGEKPRVLLRISDTGSGMTPEVRARVFEPFFSTKPGTTGSGSGWGAGLGLATVYGVVEQSGGVIEVTSSPGQGTSFSISWPAADKPAASAISSSSIEARPAIQPSRSKMTIMIVEDEPAIRALLTTSLRERGYDVLEAATGEEGLRIALGHDRPIDLVLTDVVMPKMTGRELGRRLRAALPGTRVVFMSGYSDDEAFRNEVGLIEDAFIQKPFTMDSLHDHIERVIGGGKSPASTAC